MLRINWGVHIKELDRYSWQFYLLLQESIISKQLDLKYSNEAAVLCIFLFLLLDVVTLEGECKTIEN